MELGNNRMNCTVTLFMCVFGSKMTFSEALVGIKITDQFIKLLSQVDRDEERPWSMLYSQTYFDKLFTHEMANRLTSIWEGISGNWKFISILLTF